MTESLLEHLVQLPGPNQILFSYCNLQELGRLECALPRHARVSQFVKRIECSRTHCPWLFEHTPFPQLTHCTIRSVWGGTLDFSVSRTPSLRHMDVLHAIDCTLSVKDVPLTSLCVSDCFGLRFTSAIERDNLHTLKLKGHLWESLPWDHDSFPALQTCIFRPDPNGRFPIFDSLRFPQLVQLKLKSWSSGEDETVIVDLPHLRHFSCTSTSGGGQEDFETNRFRVRLKHIDQLRSLVAKQVCLETTHIAFPKLKQITWENVKWNHDASEMAPSFPQLTHATLIGWNHVHTDWPWHQLCVFWSNAVFDECRFVDQPHIQEVHTCARKLILSNTPALHTVVHSDGVCTMTNLPALQRVESISTNGSCASLQWDATVDWSSLHTLRMPVSNEEELERVCTQLLVQVKQLQHLGLCVSFRRAHLPLDVSRLVSLLPSRFLHTLTLEGFSCSKALLLCGCLPSLSRCVFLRCRLSEVQCTHLLQLNELQIFQCEFSEQIHVAHLPQLSVLKIARQIPIPDLFAAAEAFRNSRIPTLHLEELPRLARVENIGNQPIRLVCVGANYANEKGRKDLSRIQKAQDHLGEFL